MPELNREPTDLMSGFRLSKQLHATSPRAAPLRNLHLLAFFQRIAGAKDNRVGRRNTPKNFDCGPEATSDSDSSHLPFTDLSHNHGPRPFRPPELRAVRH